MIAGKLIFPSWESHLPMVGGRLTGRQGTGARPQLRQQGQTKKSFGTKITHPTNFHGTIMLALLPHPSLAPSRVEDARAGTRACEKE